MPRSQRVAQFIQRLAYENIFERDERDDPRADRDVLSRMPESSPSYPAWSATSFSSYVPFRGPYNG
jgi:hypothetical protein